MIRTENITKTYRNGYQAVKGLSLQVDQGDLFGFLGPNGAGKTTTIRMLDGLLEPTSGSVYIDGMDIRKQPEAIKQRIGVVPESHGYYYWMTAREYLQYFSALFRQRDADIDGLLDRVGLAEKKDVTVGQFSRGMKQRLGIAKSLVNRPKIIFLDEPTLGLDPRGQREIQQLLLDISHNDGITVFITSHMPKDIEVLCNRVCIVKDGRMIEQGTLPGLKAKYMRNYTMRIRTTNDQSALPVMRSVASMQSAQLTAEGVEITLEEGLPDMVVNRVKHQLLAEVFTHGIDITEMAHKSLSIEDIFFRATETGGSQG